MRGFGRAVAVGFLVLLATRGRCADDNSEIQVVLKTDAAYREAVLRGDILALKDLLTDDIVIVHSDGDTDNRANFLESISSGRLKMLSYDRSDVSVRIHGSTALLVSRSSKKFTYRGSPATDDDTSLVTYIKENGRWKMAGMQNTHRPR
jgi:ketosteroid isomerase-like protein